MTMCPPNSDNWSLGRTRRRNTDFFVYQVDSRAQPDCRRELDKTSYTPGAGTRAADVTTAVRALSNR
jgi:hypothetical protein